jgi:hypothetical protein
MSAALARCITNPVERIEILRQVENVDYKGLNILQTVKKIYTTQGILGFYKGGGTLIAWVVPFSAIEFYSVEMYRNFFIRGNKEKQSLLYNILCGGLAGLTANTLTFPLDVARTRISINTQNSTVKESTIRTSLFNLWSKEGIYGIYRGFMVSSIVSILYFNSHRELLYILDSSKHCLMF